MQQELWYGRAMEAEKLERRVQLVIGQSQLDEIEDWRRRQHPIPSRNEAMRRLLARGLEAEARDTEKSD